MNLEEKQDLYDRFLATWPEERVQRMSLADYVDVENHETFCYWVERETRYLGSILGSPAIKFGIYRRKIGNGPVANYANDAQYSWRPFHGKDRDEAFESVRKNILRVIRYAGQGDFSKIDDLSLSPMFKWKIAFLYSNERLVPIYEEKTLRRIAESYGLPQGQRIIVSQIQDRMMREKPGDLSIYEYMEQLWNQFGEVEEEPLGQLPLNEHLHGVQARRRAATELNLSTQLRSVSRSYLVEQKHKKLQKLLQERLIEEFGTENVRLEEDYVDVKLIQPTRITLYEVKSSSFALECVREAVGQLLFYSIRDPDPRPKRLVVIGQFEPNESETRFLEKLRESLTVDLSYEYLPLN